MTLNQESPKSFISIVPPEIAVCVSEATFLSPLFTELAPPFHSINALNWVKVDPVSLLISKLQAIIPVGIVNPL